MVVLLAVTLLCGIIILVVYQLDNIGKNNNSMEKEKTIEELYGYEEGDILTKDQISDVVDQYVEENPAINNYEIYNQLSEDYNDMVAFMYQSGYMIDDHFSDEDNEQVMAWADIHKRKYMNVLPVKKIVNPIDDRVDMEKENRLHKISDIYPIDHEEKIYFKDTKGFCKLDDLNIGYPMISTPKTLRNGEIITYLHFKILIEENIQRKELDDFFKKYENIEVNGKNLTEDLGIYTKKDDEDFWNESFANKDDYVFLKNNVLDVKLRFSLNDLFEYEFPDFSEKYVYKLNDHEKEIFDLELDKVFSLDNKNEIDENPLITINGKSIELSNILIIEESENNYKGDVKIKPKVRVCG